MVKSKKKQQKKIKKFKKTDSMMWHEAGFDWFIRQEEVLLWKIMKLLSSKITI